MSEDINLGVWGEDHAVRMLIDEGYDVIERNWRCGHLEIDIIAENSDAVVFVEVKTRSQLYGGHEPYEAVNFEKKRRLIKAINAYIKLKRVSKVPRFDIIGIQVVDGRIIKRTHLVDVLTPLNFREHPFSFHWGKWHSF